MEQKEMMFYKNVVKAEPPTPTVNVIRFIKNPNKNTDLDISDFHFLFWLIRSVPASQGPVKPGPVLENLGATMRFL